MSHQSQVTTTRLTNAGHTTAILSQSPLTTPRLSVGADDPRGAVWDGAWWPRSRDPGAELPGLILALDDRVGAVERLMLGAAEWDSFPKRLVIDGRFVRFGWYASQPRGLLIVTGSGGRRLDLLVVPPDADPSAAEAAMSTAIAVTSIQQAHALLDGLSARPDTDAVRQSAWDNEGGVVRGGK